jgi:hypothetical protein
VLRDSALTKELASLETFFDHMTQLQGRFAERDNFRKQVVGHAIEWRGLVRNALDHETSLSLSITSTNGKFLNGFVADFPARFRSRVLALKPGDVVRIGGTIREIWPEGVPSVSATNFWLETP